MKRILLILTGGTIASVETEQGLRPGISEEELRESLSGITDFCQVEILSLLNVDSTNIQPEHWQMIVQAIEKRFDCMMDLLSPMVRIRWHIQRQLFHI